MLIGGDVDAIAGLLVLRERQPFTVYAPRAAAGCARGQRVFDVLDPTLVRRVAILPLQPVACGGGLTLTLLPMPGKVPLYRENAGRDRARGRSDLRRNDAGERP